jgi:hypothetical protein
MTSHINNRDLFAQNLSTREALVGSELLIVHGLVEKFMKRPVNDPDGYIDEQLACEILMHTAPVIDMIFGRKPFNKGDASRLELIAKLARLSVPVMPTYPVQSDLDAHEEYTQTIDRLMWKHIEEVDKALPIKDKKGRGDFAASCRWCEDVAENGYDQRGR